MLCKTSAKLNISIHALVKRATTNSLGALLQKWISIHALVKRATPQFPLPKKKSQYFNPRPREEGDKYDRQCLNPEDNFNPRPREEGDLARSPSRSIAVISIHALVKRATANFYNDYLYFEAKYHISDIFPL